MQAGVFFGGAHCCDEHSIFLRLGLCCSQISSFHAAYRMTIPGLLISLEEAVMVRSLFSDLVHTILHADSKRKKEKPCTTSSFGSIHLLWFPHFQFARDGFVLADAKCSFPSSFTFATSHLQQHS